MGLQNFIARRLPAISATWLNLVDNFIIGTGDRSPYARTDDEITTGVVPINYAFLPGYAARYGFSATASAATNTTAITNAFKCLPFIAVGTRGGCVYLPAGNFNVNEIIVPAYCWLVGASLDGTSLNYSGTGYLISLGSSTANNTSKPGCGVIQMRLLCSSRTGNALLIQECTRAVARDLYIEGYTDSGAHLSRTNVGITVDGGTGTAGCFVNFITNVVINHVQIGVHFISSGGQRSTSTFLKNVNVQGDDATYGATSGWKIEKGQGDGSVWDSGNFEHLSIGIDPQAGTSTPADMGALSFTAEGLRFESCTLDISSANFQQPSSFLGICTETEFSVSDANHIYTFLGCTTTSNGAWVNRLAGGLIVPQHDVAGAYGVTKSDAGKTIYQTSAGTITIPANASVPFPVGTKLVIINGTGGNITIAITTDTMVLAVTGTVGARTLAALGVARLHKIETTEWIIEGPGVS